MNEAIVNNINSLVKEDDILYCLGDWSFGGIENIWNFRKQINCKNIHLILGNHDHHIEKNKIIPNTINSLKDLFVSVQHYKEIIIDKQKIVLCHYAMRVWNQSHKGSWMLYGHSHGTLDEMTPEFSNPTWIGDQYYIKNYKTMDVGMDTNNLKPYSFEEIKLIMDKREVLLNVDHYTK